MLPLDRRPKLSAATSSSDLWLTVKGQERSNFKQAQMAKVAVSMCGHGDTSKSFNGTLLSKLWLRSQRSKKGRILQNTKVTCDYVQICLQI